MRIRAQENNGIVDVKILIRHDMESGLRKGEDGSLVPAWFIHTLRVQAQGKEVFSAQLGPAVSRDPFFNFKYQGAKGDRLLVTWIDTKDDRRSDEVIVS
jgi:sulfur-oxidizing protein SoxZ